MDILRYNNNMVFYGQIPGLDTRLNDEQKRKKKDGDGRIKCMGQEQNVEKKNSSALHKSRISFSEGYFFFKNRIKSEFNINGDGFDFTKLSKREKTVKIVSCLKKFHD